MGFLVILTELVLHVGEGYDVERDVWKLKEGAPGTLNQKQKIKAENTDNTSVQKKRNKKNYFIKRLKQDYAGMKLYMDIYLLGRKQKHNTLEKIQKYKSGKEERNYITNNTSEMKITTNKANVRSARIKVDQTT